MLKVLCAYYWEMEPCYKILCADYARLGFYYARHYAQHYARAAFIMRGIMRGACNTAIHYARIMRACVLLCSALCATLCADSSHYARNAYSALCPPWLSTPPALRGYACPTTPPLSTHIMARLRQPMLLTSVITVKSRRA